MVFCIIINLYSIYQGGSYMFKTVRAKIMAPITLIVVLIIAIFSLFIYTMTNNSIKQNGEALVQSVSLGLNNALTARDVAENIMEREMIGQSVMASYIINQGGTYEELKKLPSAVTLTKFGVPMIKAIRPKRRLRKKLILILVLIQTDKP